MKPADWNHLKAFAETAQSGSFSAAARRLGLTQPTLGRQVAALEQQLGVTLFERVGKRLRPTATGLALLEHAQGMAAAAQALAITASARSQAVSGVVSVSASDVVAARLLPPVLRRLRQRAPGLAVEVVTSNALSDLRRGEADIAVRHVRPDDPALIGRWLRDATAGFYAARSWVRAHGHPRRAADLADGRHDGQFVGVDRGGRYHEYLRQHGLPLGDAPFACFAENSLTSWALVREGLGIGAMMDEVAQRDPDVVRVLDEVPPVHFPMWLVTHRELHTARRIRLVFDELAACLAQPAGEAPA